MTMSDLDIQERKTCRVCGSKNLVDVLSLGEQYVVNFVDSPTDKAYKCPLDLVMCDASGGGCGLLQLKHTFNHDILYRKYWYRSGTSTTMVKQLNDVVKSAEEYVKPEQGDIVVDIGANDGTLLTQYSNNGIKRVGFEPSNLWEEGRKEGLTMIHDYFNYATFKKYLGEEKAKIITSIAMFYDLEDPNTFVEDIKRCLDKDGLWIIQMNYLGKMLENNTFDNISHEHLEYYSLASLEYLLAKHGLEAFNIELNDVNGGSFRVYIRSKGSKIGSDRGLKHLQELRDYESIMALKTKSTYDKFAMRVKTIKDELLTLLNSEKEKGRRIFIYGASTRGLVVLQYAKIDNKLIEAAVDKNQDKWGKYIIGTGIPIISIDEYRKKKPDYLFVLPYHFLNEIMQQEQSFISGGGKLIIAIPQVKVING